MDTFVDKSLGGLKYALTIIKGRNRQVNEFIHHLNNEEHIISGDFILTIGKKAVILTRDRKPIIVKRWTSIPLEDYINESNFAPFFLSGVKIAEVFKDSDNWIWEGVVAEEINHFNVIHDSKILYTISF